MASPMCEALSDVHLLLNVKALGDVKSALFLNIRLLGLI